MAWAGFNVKFIKKEENRQSRLARKVAAQSAIAAVMEDAAMEDAASTGEDVDGEERLADGADEGEAWISRGGRAWICWGRGPARENPKRVEKRAL